MNNGDTGGGRVHWLFARSGWLVFVFYEETSTLVPVIHMLECIVSAHRRRSADTGVRAQQTLAVGGGKGAGVVAGVVYAEEKSRPSAV